MANFVAMFRSNYFYVKEDAAFLDAIAQVPGLEAHRREPSRADTPFALFCPDGEPTADIHDNELNLALMLAEHLSEGEVAILIEVGFEKLRYLAGSARAVHQDGRQIVIDLSDIYDQVKADFGVSVTRAEW